MATDDLRTGTWVTYVGSEPSSVQVRRCHLTVTSGPDRGKVYELESNIIRIGARQANNVQLHDPQASGSHCEIHLTETGYRLRDLDSTNGTFVSGLRVNDIHIDMGTEISVGGSTLVFTPLGESVEVSLSSDRQFGSLIGASIPMRELFARLEKLAASDATALVTGETGVGKELVAESLHQRSTRKHGPFVVVDCGAIPQNLIESELFGHEKGAFTGATQKHIGAFERAHGGTIFLDEIGELPIDMQPKLLRVLERRESRSIGGTQTQQLDFRIIAATNRNLSVEVNRGRFREDLYYRLAVASLRVPPLRERRDDIPLLVEHILTTLPGGDAAEIAPETIELMKRHDWPGNVRELRNVIERAVLLSEPPADTDSFRAQYAPAHDVPTEAPNQRPAGVADDADLLSMRVDIEVPFKVAKRDLVTEFERRYVTRLLSAHQGNISAAARAAGIDRMSIHKMLNRLGLSK